MKRYLRSSNCEAGTDNFILSGDTVEIDPDTYDDSNDSDDTYYSCDSFDELMRWLNRERD